MLCPLNGRPHGEYGKLVAQCRLAGSAEDYANQASEFFQRGIQENMPIKIDEDGVIRIYDPQTNTFGAYKC